MGKDWEKYKKLKYDDFASFKKRNYKDGVMTLNLSLWDEFLTARQIFTDKGVDKDYFWRGQRCYCEEWLLKSSFDRTNRFAIDKERKKRLVEILNEFKSCLRDIKTEYDDLEEDYIWAIGQHYGLPTQLLDWTNSPYIATFNAFFGEVNNWQTENRVIYALNRASKLLLRKPSRQLFIEILDFPEIPGDKQLNDRLKNQKGMFKKALNGTDIKSNVEKFSRRVNKIIDNKKMALFPKRW